MASEILAALIAYVLGWGGLRFFTAGTGIVFIATAAFLAGSSLWVITAAIVLAVGISFHPVLPTVICLIAVAILNGLWGSRPQVSELVAVAAGMFVTVLLVAAFVTLDLVQIGHDGMWTLYLADELFVHGDFSDSTRMALLRGTQPMVLPLISSAAVAMNLTHFSAFQPLIGMYGLVLFGVLGQRTLAASGGTQNMNIILPALAVGALATSPFLIGLGLHFKSQGLVMTHMLVACAALYLATVERSQSWYFAALSFTAPMVLMRQENGLTLLPVLVVAATVGHIPLRLRLLGVGGTAMLWGLWYLFVLLEATYFDGIDRSWISKILLLTGAVPGFFGFLLMLGLVANGRWVSTDSIERTINFLPVFMVLILVSSLIGQGIMDFDRAVAAINVVFCVFANPNSGVFGYGATVAFLLALASWVTRPLPESRLILFILLGYLLCLPLATFQMNLSGPCTSTEPPSRILVHALPALLFYAMLKFGGANGRPKRVRTTD